MQTNRLVALILTATLALAGCAVPTAGSSASSSAATSSATAASSSSSNVSSQQQKDWSKARVSYLGPEGTYTQEACQLFFGGQGTYLPQEDVAASVKAVLDGTTDYAVIPQENTIGGPIAEYLDEVVTHDNIGIVGEVELPISQNLLTKPGADLAGIKTVYSHKQGIAQGSEWLKKNLHNAEVIEVASTAEGARMASEAQGNDCAAIGSSAAAGVYGLEVAADNIQMSSANKTRFYVLSTQEPSKEPASRMAFLASGKASDLGKLLEDVKSAGATVVTVHDRPRKTELGEYTYLVECSNMGFDAYDTLTKDNQAFVFRYLGSFDVR